MPHPLKKYREDHRLTQAELGARFKVERVTVARWETGLRKIGMAMLPIVSERTGIPKRILRPDLAKLFDGAAQ